MKGFNCYVHVLKIRFHKKEIRTMKKFYSEASAALIIFLILITSTASAASVTDLKTLGGVGNTFAYSINDNGQIVGSSYTSTGQEHACYWENSNSTPIDLGTIQGAKNSFSSSIFSRAIGINKKGQIVGESSAPSGYPDACYWENINSAPIDLGTLGEHSQANFINNNGQILGDGLINGDDRPIYWANSHSLPRDLGTLAMDFSGASGINDNGLIVGSSLTSTDQCDACYWANGNSKPIDLGSIGAANGVNNNGQIIGTCSTSTGSSSYACFWANINSIPTDLGENYNLESINNNGQIIGTRLTRQLVT